MAEQHLSASDSAAERDVAALTSEDKRLRQLIADRAVADAVLAEVEDMAVRRAGMRARGRRSPATGSATARRDRSGRDSR